MITEDKITEIFFMADEFCKVFDQMLRRKGLVPHNPLRKRNYHRPGRLTHAEIITILIMFHCGGYRYLKHFYLGHICTNCRYLFPEVMSYNRFVELEKTVVVHLAVFIKKCLLRKCTGISFADSTLLRVYRNQRIHSHRVFKGLAQRGKCSLGWFYGFKLHLICNDRGEILNFMITPGNVDDREPLKMRSFIEAVYGKLVADKGYISKELFCRLFFDGIQLVTKLKANMKGGLMSIQDKILLRKRAIIETVNDELKNIAQVNIVLNKIRE